MEIWIVAVAVLLVILVIVITCYFFAKNTGSKGHDYLPDLAANPKLLADRVLDIGTYHEVDEAGGLRLLAHKYDGWRGCSAVAKKTDNGVIIGRNMDLNVSDKPAYVFRLDLGGSTRKALGIAYTATSGTDFEKARNGIDRNFARTIPLMAADFINDRGLYIETNMRPGETDEEEEFNIFGSPGTNKGSDIRMPMLSVPYYLATRCADIDEAVELAKKLDIYTLQSENMDWNLSLLMADSKGNSGILEVIDGKAIFVSGGKAAAFKDGNTSECSAYSSGGVADGAAGWTAQTNFFTEAGYEAKESYGMGYGRYEHIRNNIGSVSDIAGMKPLMDDLRYSMCYDLSGVKWDIRSEYAGYIPLKEDGKGGLAVDWDEGDTSLSTSAALRKMDKDQVLKGIGEYIASMEENDRWMTVYTTVADTGCGKMLVRFFEKGDFIELEV